MELASRVQCQAIGDGSPFAAAMLSVKPKPRRGRTTRAVIPVIAGRHEVGSIAGTKAEAVSTDLCHGEKATVVKDGTSSISENDNQNRIHSWLSMPPAESSTYNKDKEQSLQIPTDTPARASAHGQRFRYQSGRQC